ncbi:WAS/WASL-interacting protein family member 2-like isoform X3 [Eriocheir sinensis]|nr:WAS/WASL-interacting protein family member 2-like isoform X3 [Eriocheir sinensis]XP_050692672.1 WAS/WASL-interacting protein family member 2-like isoform X3 [Eriocheir sinensis]
MAGPGRSLRVLERDGFFDDAFFREAWDDFDRAMQSVLDRFDSTGLKPFRSFPSRSFPSLSRRHTATHAPPPPPPSPPPQQVMSRSLPRQVDDGSRNHCRDVYSKIRSSKIDEDLYASQALQITEKDGKFQVVMDVKDFNPRELQVRAVDDRIVVEGSYQKVSEDGVSSSCKSFYKEFTLPPAADLDQVSTALSRDGVLTIRAPRKDGATLTDAPRAAPVANTSTSSTSSSTQQQFSDNSSTSSFKSTSSRRVIQSSSSFESSSDGFDSLPKEMREKLMFCDSGFGSTKTSTCSSPAPSEAGSESSRVSSTMEFDLSKRAPVKTEVAFNVSKASQGPPPHQATPQQAHPPNYPQSPPPQPQPPQQPYQQFPGQQHPQQYNQFQQYQQPAGAPQYPQSPPPQAQCQSPSQYQSPPPQYPQSPPPQAQYQSPQPQFQPPQQQFQQSQPPQQYTPQYPPQQFAPQAPQSIPATGTGNQTSVSVTEENGRRVVTSQTSNVVQEKDGFKEHRETAAEITDKDSQAARKEATTKLSKVEEDPEGKFKRAESTDANEVSETCIQHLPDGSVMSVKKNSTSSSSSFKQSFSTGISGGDIMGGFYPPPPNFLQGFDDFRSLMGRGHSLMTQMSTDSMGSTLSGRSGFTDMSNFSNFTDGSSPFSDTSFGNMSNFTSRSKNFQQQQQPPQQQQYQQPPQQQSQQPQQEFGSPRRKGFSTSSSTSSTSNFTQSFSNFGDGNF